MRVRLVRLPVILLTLVLAWPSFALSQPESTPAPSSTRREVRVGVPGVPAALDPAVALEGTIPLIARQVFDTLVAYHDGTTDVEPALATRWSVSRDYENPRVILGRAKLLDWIRTSATSDLQALAGRVYAAHSEVSSAGCSFSLDILHAEIRDFSEGHPASSGR